MHLFISAGEPSGDLHAANLARAIFDQNPSARIVGFGGDHLLETGAEVLFPLARHSVMWIPHVFRSLGTYTQLLKQADSYFQRRRPDALVMIDYPGFHWWLARQARHHGIPVYYFVPPQLWAWGGWRVRKMRRFVNYVICSLPFEVKWFAARGVRALYFGHPFFDEMVRRPVNRQRVTFLQERGRPIITLLPGSRHQEIVMNWPSLLRAARTILHRQPNARILVAAYSSTHAETIRQTLSPLETNIEVLCRETPEAIEAADCTIAVSGSVSLELLNALKPSMITYRINYVQHVLKSLFMKVRYMSLVNLLAQEEIFPEYLSIQCRSQEMACKALHWLNEPMELTRIRSKLRALRDRLALPGACAKAAQFIRETCQKLESRSKAISIGTPS
jgi:lipid-A-disaccharide synthase